MTDWPQAAFDFGRREVAGRRDLRSAETVPPDLWASLGETGLCGISIGKRFGGAGLDHAAQAAVAESLVRGGGSLGFASAWQSHVRQTEMLVGGHASETQKACWLPEMAAGRLVPSIAISEEGVGAHPKRLSTRATPVEGGWRLDGQKAYVSNGMMAGIFFVLAITEEVEGRKRYTFFAVPKGRDGVELRPGKHFSGLEPTSHVTLGLSGVPVGEADVLGSIGDAYEAIARPIRDHEDWANLGVRFGAMAAEIDYLSTILDHEDARELIGGLAVDLEAMRLLRDQVGERKGDERERLLNALRRQMRGFHESVANLMPRTPPDEEGERMAHLHRGLGILSNVARYVERIRLERVGDAWIHAAG